MSSSFRVTGMEKATVSKDRTQWQLTLRTNKELLLLSLSADHLAELISMLEGLESAATLHSPAHGQMLGEQVGIRAVVVDRHNVGNGLLNGVPSVLLGLGAGKVFRWFGLDTSRAVAIRNALEVEIPKLETGSGTGH